MFWTGHNNGCLQRALLFPTSASTNEAFYGYGLPPSYVTLPRLSRMGRGFPEGNVQKDSLVDSGSGGGATPTCSDSLTDLTDFTFDLGPSLMSEILSLIDSRCGLLGGGIEAEGRGDEEEEEGVDEEDEEDEHSSSVLQVALESPASSPTTTSTRGSSRASDWMGRAAAPVMGGSGGGDTQRTPAPDASCHSPQGAEPGMEAERFQRASSILSRHYGGGSFSHPDAASSPPRRLRPAASFSSSRTSEREEEEIRV
ncbi:hypothetical protein CRUP_037280 [Coryphaenoides rupestris]|nr:hypothetical protein CRUP_037280 [Coryphaenoides rupestris]